MGNTENENKEKKPILTIILLVAGVLVSLFLALMIILLSVGVIKTGIDLSNAKKTTEIVTIEADGGNDSEAKKSDSPLAEIEGDWRWCYDWFPCYACRLCFFDINDKGIMSYDVDYEIVGFVTGDDLYDESKYPRNVYYSVSAKNIEVKEVNGIKEYWFKMDMGIHDSGTGIVYNDEVDNKLYLDKESGRIIYEYYCPACGEWEKACEYETFEARVERKKEEAELEKQKEEAAKKEWMDENPGMNYEDNENLENGKSFMDDIVSVLEIECGSLDAFYEKAGNNVPDYLCQVYMGCSYNDLDYVTLQIVDDMVYYLWEAYEDITETGVVSDETYMEFGAAMALYD